jgi:hypothetical protein
VTAQDKAWLDGITVGYFIALFCAGNESDIAIARERFNHGIESLAQREYHRGFEDGVRIAGRES